MANDTVAKYIRNTSLKENCFNLVANNYIFYKNKTHKVSTCWNCSKRKFGCKATATTRGKVGEKEIPKIIKISSDSDHFHPANPLKVKFREVMVDAKRKLVELPTANVRCCPTIFKQLFTVHGVFKGHPIPLIYALLPDKNLESYSTLFKFLSNYDFEPLMIISDYELGIVSAARKEFPNTEIRGCLFHLGQNIWRRIQAEGLTEKYNSDDKFKTFARCFIALAFVPENSILDAFRALIQVLPKELRPIRNYFKTNYIGTMLIKPAFPHSMWSVYSRVLEDQPRTTNAVEGWHHGFNVRLNCSHPGFWTFLDTIKLEQNAQENKLQRIMSGEVRKQEVKYAELNARVKNKALDYQNSENAVLYLREMSVNLNFGE